MHEATPAPIASDEYRARVTAAQHALADRDIDGLLCLDYHDVVYLSGFHHSPNERPVGLYVAPDGVPCLFVPRLEREHAEAVWDGPLEVYEEYPGDPHPVVWMAERIDARRYGVDALDLRVAQLLQARGRAPVACDAIERLRWIKSEAELDLTRVAARFADRCLEHVLAGAGDIVRHGGTELDILDAALSATRSDMTRALGTRFEGTPTRVVGTVHTGPRAALPHGRTSERRPERGDVLIAGIGVAVGGYHAESGATFTFGTPSAEQHRCLEAADACDRAAREACRPGQAGTHVNAVAHGVLRDAGLGDTIRHRIGHGMGLQGHESPWLAPGGGEPIAVGMVFSNEPGIYRPGVDGYRTINSMIVTATETEVPSRFQDEHPIEARVLEP